MAINNIPLWQANDMFDMAGFNAKIGVENDNFSQLKMGGAITKNLPIAAGQTIAAGDVVDVVGGEVQKTITSSQAIALQPGTAGQSIDIILSGVAELPGITAGTEIISPGVYGYCPIDGWVDVISEWAKNAGVQIAHGEYVGTGTYGSANPTKIILPFVPQLLIVCDKIDGSGGYPWVRGVPKGISTGTSTSASVLIVWSDKITSFYNSVNADLQFNTNNRPYIFFAIGGGK